ncbi:hypothetical protein Adt_32412 [Abeliophyllum distichum]|uniref:Uncharacterized protein n=1 Tax=Abeliophyllum distichum TaxID=126358 RepID=A0ABD1QU67_9LAMI
MGDEEDEDKDGDSHKVKLVVRSTIVTAMVMMKKKRTAKFKWCHGQILLESKFASSNLALDYCFQESEIAGLSNSFKLLKLQRADTTKEEALIKYRTVAIISSLRRLQ